MPGCSILVFSINFSGLKLSNFEVPNDWGLVLPGPILGTDLPWGDSWTG